MFLADIDECRENPQVCGPSAVCSNQPGTFRCECFTGFTFASDGRTCIGMFELIVCVLTAVWVGGMCGSCVTLLKESLVSHTDVPQAANRHKQWRFCKTLTVDVTHYSAERTDVTLFFVYIPESL